MKSTTHRFILPPVFLGVHFLLLLPIFFSRPDLRWISKAANPTPYLNLRNAVIFGLAGFVLTFWLKQIAGRIPLPALRRRRKLAEWLEVGILFGMGVLEEVLRYGVVQLLMKMHDDAGVDPKGIGKRPGWETAYLMGWVWSLVECAYSWWNFRPHSSPNSEAASSSTQSSPSRPRIRTRRTLSGASANSAHVTGDASPKGRRGSLKVLRRGSVLAIPGDDNLFFSNLQREARTWQTTGTDGNRSAVSLLSGGDLNGRYDEEAAVSEGNEQQTPRGIVFSSAIPGSPISRPFASILEERMGSPNSPRPDLGEPLATSDENAIQDSDFGDDEQDEDHGGFTSTMSDFSSSSSRRSSLESNRSLGREGAGTPLLSSSFPFEPSDHPHHESSSLLRNQYRPMSYSTMGGNLPAVPSGDEESDGHAVVRDYEVEDSVQPPQLQFPTVEIDSGDDDNIFQRAATERREYASYPSYSRRYNHSYFSVHNSASSPSSNTVIAGAMSKPTDRRPSDSQQTYQRLLYGVSVNSMPPILPILWRTSALLRHIASCLLFAYYPTLHKDGRVQPLAFVVVGIVALLKGWYTVKWLGGHVARSGVFWVTVVTCTVSKVAYFGALLLWGLL